MSAVPALIDTAGDTARPPIALKPRLHPRIARFLEDENSLAALAAAKGSPLNVMFPQIVGENIAAFQSVFEKHNLQGRIFISTKPNKSTAVIREAALHGTGIDVSSYGGLQAVLAAGFSPDRIECTGPKNIDYLTLAIQQGATVNADNFAELDAIIAIRLAAGISRPTKIFVRLSGFTSSRLKFTPHDSTFGIDVTETDRVFDFLTRHTHHLDFQGFSCHFNSKVMEQKTVALENLLQKTVQAMERGFAPKGIDIGGGYDILYADDPAEWKSYLDTLKQSLRNYGPSLTWNDGGLGYRFEDGLIKGAPAFLDHGIASVGARNLDDILSLTLPSFENATFAQIANDLLLEIYIEPGRAIFDQLGITVARVNHVKKSAHGETLVALDMNRSNLNSSQQKLLTDPIVIKRGQGHEPCADGVYYVGNLCLSYDMITYNKTFPQFCPQAGDLVVFVNTAAYIMDFVESQTLHQHLAEKIAVLESGQGFQWFDDEKYAPVSFRMTETARDR